MYPKWEIRFVPLLDKRGRQVEKDGVLIYKDTFCRAGGGEWESCGPIDLPNTSFLSRRSNV